MLGVLARRGVGEHFAISITMHDVGHVLPNSSTGSVIGAKQIEAGIKQKQATNVTK